MIADYVKIKQCRCCSFIRDEVRKELDLDILSGEIKDEEILRKYVSLFPPEHPLTIYALRNHKRHLMDFIAIQKLRLISIEEGKPTKTSLVEKHSEFMQKVAQDAADGIVKEDEILMSCILDAVSDIENLNEVLSSYPLTIKTSQFLITKDSIRRTLLDTLTKRKALNQATGGEIDKVNTIREVIKKLLSLCLKAFSDVEIEPEKVVSFGDKLKEKVSSDSLLSKYL